MSGILTVITKGFRCVYSPFRGSIELLGSSPANNGISKISNAILHKISSRNCGSYEGHGKTVATIVNNKDSDVLTIGRVCSQGFILANGVHTYGSMILFPHSLCAWHVTHAQFLNEDSLELFRVLDPKIDILVFGYGTREDYTPEVKKTFTQFCKTYGIAYEALPTVQAAGVFNILSFDHRYTAAALIPPSYFKTMPRDSCTTIEEIESELDEETTILPEKQDQKRLL